MPSDHIPTKRPAKWHFDGPRHNHIVWSGPSQRVCFLTSDGPTTANARLIAAAPDLLEACEQALMWVEDDETTHGRKFGTGNVLRAAIAKATGAA
jgi:hypothetical protein